LSKEDGIEVEGKIVEVMRNAKFKVRLANDHIILAYLSGKLYKNNIKVLEGDSVKVEISPYDLTQGRITWRSKGTVDNGGA
jgi:translation initiation factor IF-1